MLLGLLELMIVKNNRKESVYIQQELDPPMLEDDLDLYNQNIYQVICMKRSFFHVVYLSVDFLNFEIHVDKDFVFGICAVLLFFNELIDLSSIVNSNQNEILFSYYEICICLVAVSLDCLVRKFEKDQVLCLNFKYPN